MVTSRIYIGKVDYTLTDKMLKNREFSRSLYVVKSIKAGEMITEQNVRSIRPGYGLHPKYYKEMLGKTAKVDLEKCMPLRMDDIK